jgi:hypothetical protein
MNGAFVSRVGINVFILYATYGFLIFVAVLLDRLRVKLRRLAAAARE